jgi:hypothetical protein
MKRPRYLAFVSRHDENCEAHETPGLMIDGWCGVETRTFLDSTTDDRTYYVCQPHLDELIDAGEVRIGRR